MNDHPLETPNHKRREDCDKVSKVKNIHLVYLKLAESLANIEMLKFIKIYNERLKASNLLNENKTKDPIIEIGKEGVVGVEPLIVPDNGIIQLYFMTSDQKDRGRKRVKAVVKATPDDWTIVVALDWSRGFWKKMMEEHPRIVVF